MQEVPSMKVSIAAALLVACSAGLGAQAPQGTTPTPAQLQMKTGAPPNKTAIEKALIDAEQKISDAIVKGDAAAFKSMVATEGWSADPGGFTSVPEFEKMLKPGTAKFTD